MKKNVILFVLFASLIFYKCIDNPVESISNSYFPLKVGNQWSFRFPSWTPASGDTMITVDFKIVKMKVVNGKEYYAFNNKIPFFPDRLIIEGIDTIFVREAQNGDIMLLVGNQEYPYFVFSNTFKPDSSNLVFTKVNGVEYAYSIESINAIINTPLGWFKRCSIFSNYFPQIKGTEHQIWFSPGYGPVKIYYPELGVTYELTSLIIQ